MRSRIYSAFTLLCAAMMLVGALAAAGLAAAAESDGGATLASAGFERRVVRDDSGRSITYHISRPKRPQAPILLMIQGSGCGPVLSQQAGRVTTTIFNLQEFAREGRFTLLAVEKPHAFETLVGDGSTTSCTPAFNADFTADSWLKALQASLAHARHAPWVDASRTLVFGHSEGAIMASMLAANDAAITDVISIGGSGTTQLFDFVARAYRCFDASACLADVDRNMRDIAADPDSATRFAWGHPYKRWTSFFRVDPGENLLGSKARVYLAFGTDDRSTPALSQEILGARLRAQGRDFTLRRVADANHSLVKGSGYKTTDEEYRAALAWFWARDAAP